jgi:catechol 2,3-dioxygenase-like lactoylglutathione lyase family enzyme
VTSAGVLKLTRISLVVADLASAASFYVDGFGFARMGEEERDASQLFAMPGLSERVLTLRLGREEIELVACAPAGHAYPQAPTSADAWFQHFAIAVSDMARVYDGLVRAGRMAAITQGGPQRLPPNTGAVTAYKFRDPEGHPLELSQFPPGVGSPRWQGGGGACLGVDHSAISVADLERSEAFYAGLLGLDANFRTTNRGPEQDRLDGLHSEGVGIVALQPADPDSPHIELLHYPARRAGPQPAVNDIAATRLTLQVGDLDALAARLRAAGVAFVSPSAVALETGVRALAVRDPDGHLLILRS